MPTRGFCLQADAAGRLGLVAQHRPDWKPVVADWLTPEMRSRIRGGRRQPLARALNLHRKPGACILDATGGMGRDAYTLAALGATVVVAERQPPVVELLRDAQRRVRACAEPALVAAADRLRIVGSDARELDAAQGPFDAVYLDPMYPDEQRRALPQKEMQLLRDLAGDDLDAGSLLEHARRLAPRVAVKRAGKAPWLAGCAPDAQIEGTQTRYDLYLRAAPVATPR